MYDKFHTILKMLYPSPFPMANGKREIKSAFINKIILKLTTMGSKWYNGKLVKHL